MLFAKAFEAIWKARSLIWQRLLWKTKPTPPLNPKRNNKNITEWHGVYRLSRRRHYWRKETNYGEEADRGWTPHPPCMRTFGPVVQNLLPNPKPLFISSVFNGLCVRLAGSHRRQSRHTCRHIYICTTCTLHTHTTHTHIATFMRMAKTKRKNTWQHQDAVPFGERLPQHVRHTIFFLSALAVLVLALSQPISQLRQSNLPSVRRCICILYSPSSSELL